jgi:hypothetical protein
MHKELSILTIEHPLERQARIALLALLAVFIIGYLYCVSSSVLNVIARKEAAGRAAQLEGRIGQREQEYFRIAEGVTPEAGIALGLAPVAQTDYVRVQGAVAARFER